MNTPAPELLLSSDVELHLRPRVRDEVNQAIRLLGRLVERFAERSFEPQACRRILEEHLDGGPLRRYFMPANLANGGRVVRDELLYLDRALDPESWDFAIRSAQADFEFAAQIDVADLPALAACARRATRATDEDDLCDALSFLGEFAGKLVDRHSSACPRGLTMSKPGIYRREHGSLAIRSATTTLLFDPIAWCVDKPAQPPIDIRPRQVDAVFITHTHTDHWHLPSTLHFATGRIIVPKVPELTLLARQNPAAELRSVGAGVEAPEWGTRFEIGDIEVEALPFYGEQPTAEPPGPPPQLRNWGNTYYIRTPQFSCVVLADCGVDPLGDTADVIEELAERRGPIDAIASCTREFHCPFFGGLSEYWATLPFERLTALYRRYQDGTLPYATAGTRRIADVCKRGKARVFLPYAHGFSGLGEPIADVGWGFGEPSEATMNDRIRGALTSPTEVVDWNAGDSIHFEGASRSPLRTVFNNG